MIIHRQPFLHPSYRYYCVVIKFNNFISEKEQKDEYEDKSGNEKRNRQIEG